eukprot:12578441-Alexandrium_andersonii.AAC.1
MWATAPPTPSRTCPGTCRTPGRPTAPQRGSRPPGPSPNWYLRRAGGVSQGFKGGGSPPEKQR